MSPFQVLSVIACCVAVFVGVVTFLSSQGVPPLLAVLSVYLFAVGCMLGMQRRARESCEGLERGLRRRADSPRRRASGEAVAKGDERAPGYASERAPGYASTGLREPFRSGA